MFWRWPWCFEYLGVPVGNFLKKKINLDSASVGYGKVFGMFKRTGRGFLENGFDCKASALFARAKPFIRRTAWSTDPFIAVNQAVVRCFRVILVDTASLNTGSRWMYFRICSISCGILCSGRRIRLVDKARSFEPEPTPFP